MRTLGWAAILAVFVSSAIIAPARAVPCYLLTDGNQLLKFDSATPGTVTTTAITGLPAGFQLLGMALRLTTQTTGATHPGVGSFWGVASDTLGTDFRLVVINPNTGATAEIALLGALGASPGTDGWSLAFNPGTDRFQFQGVELNYQINPNTGAVTKQGNLGPGFPAYSGAAFSTASFGAPTLFYNIDCGGTPDSLQRMTNIAAGGNPAIVGPIGFDAARPVGLAISGSAALLAAGGNLYAENLSTGAATLIGAIGGAPITRGLVIYPSSFPPVLPVTVKIKGKKKIVVSSPKRTIKGTAASGAGIKSVRVKVGKKPFKTAKGTTRWKFVAHLKPGLNKIRVQATGGNDRVSATAKAKIVRTVPTSSAP